MALVIEDGSGVTGANSYVTLQEVKDYAALRGLSLPETDPGIEIFIVQAFDYLESFRKKYQGQRTVLTQRTEFPRTGVVIDGYYSEPNSIPWQLKAAQCQATAEAFETDLMPNLTPGIKKEKVSVLEVEYQASASGLMEEPSFPKVDTLLEPLFNATSGWRPKVVRG